MFTRVSPANGRALLIVADGLGGMGDDGTTLGKFASQLAIDTIYYHLRDLLGQGEADAGAEAACGEGFSEEYLIERFHVAIRRANSILSGHQPAGRGYSFERG